MRSYMQGINRVGMHLGPDIKMTSIIASCNLSSCKPLTPASNILGIMANMAAKTYKKSWIGSLVILNYFLLGLPLMHYFSHAAFLTTVL